MFKRLSKIFICLFLSIITLFGCSNAVLEDYSKYLTFEPISATECSVKLNENGYAASKIVIPSKHNQFDVTLISSDSFKGAEYLKEIVIPDSVTYIGKGAFSGCSSLMNITLPFVGEKADGSGETHSGFGYIFGYEKSYQESLKEVIITGGTIIGAFSFEDCTSLTSVTIGNGVTSIGSYAFDGCSSLTSIVIPDSVTSIGDYAFRGCSSLTSIYIPDSVTYIGDGAFSRCSSLTSIAIPNGVTHIGEYAFSKCESLTSIVIPDSVTYIGQGAFYNCSSLMNITLPFVNKYFGYIFGASSYDDNHARVPTSLKEVIITSGKSIGECAFYNCESLTSIVIPDSVTSIGYYAFSRCSSLTSIYIPDSVTSIGSSAFKGCSSLTIYCEAESQPSGWDSDWNYSNRPVVWGWKE